MWSWGRVTYVFCTMFLWATCIVFACISIVCLACLPRLIYMHVNPKIRNAMTTLSPIKNIILALFSQIQKRDAHDILIISNFRG